MKECLTVIISEASSRYILEKMNHKFISHLLVSEELTDTSTQAISEIYQLDTDFQVYA